jgi:fermentation-respiration switch protein FrsA (DUF1100 family)
MIIRTTFIFLSISVAVLALLWLGQRKLIYLPSNGPLQAPPGTSEVSFDTEDGLRLAAWLTAPTGPDRGVAVLVAHGNGGDRADRVPLAQALAGHGLTVLLIDYRGYGGNPGSPSEAGLYKDMSAGFGYLRRSFPDDKIILFGESLGTAVATQLATRVTARGLVLRSPFVDLPSVGAKHYPFLPVRLMMRDRFPLADTIPEVKCPISVVYGERDSIVPPEQSAAVAARAGVAPIVIPGADHNDLVLLDGPQLVGAVLALA